MRWSRGCEAVIDDKTKITDKLTFLRAAFRALIYTLNRHSRLPTGNKTPRYAKPDEKQPRYRLPGTRS